MNKVFLVGNLSSDVDKKTTSTGVSYCRFAIAVNRRFAKQGDESAADFFNILCWRGLADTCANNLVKGRKVAITGSIQINKFQGQDGTSRQSIEIVADDVEFLTPKDGARATSDGADSNEPIAPEEDTTVAEGDLQF